MLINFEFMSDIQTNIDILVTTYSALHVRYFPTDH